MKLNVSSNFIRILEDCILAQRQVIDSLEQDELYDIPGSKVSEIIQNSVEQTKQDIAVLQNIIQRYKEEML